MSSCRTVSGGGGGGGGGGADGGGGIKGGTRFVTGQANCTIDLLASGQLYNLLAIVAKCMTKSLDISDVVNNGDHYTILGTYVQSRDYCISNQNAMLAEDKQINCCFYEMTLAVCGWPYLKPLPGHVFVHGLVSVDVPGQETPPLDGSGLLQTRVLCRVPSPHDTEHSPRADQELQTPLTG